jgi:hypothetical protein
VFPIQSAKNCLERDGRFRTRKSKTDADTDRDRVRKEYEKQNSTVKPEARRQK